MVRSLHLPLRRQKGGRSNPSAPSSRFSVGRVRRVVIAGTLARTHAPLIQYVGLSCAFSRFTVLPNDDGIGMDGDGSACASGTPRCVCVSTRITRMQQCCESTTVALNNTGEDRTAHCTCAQPGRHVNTQGWKHTVQYVLFPARLPS